MKRRCPPLFFWAALFFASVAKGQTPPEIAYIYPPGGAPGTTVDVQIGGYNWTPDMQLFVHDPRVKLELLGPPGPVIVPAPPYWLGKKARDNDFPLPREFPARLTIAADAPPGLVRWQAANANGATAVAGQILISDQALVREQRLSSEPQAVPPLPCMVTGQVSKLEEVDHYLFKASRAGPVTVDLFSRRLGSKLNAIVEIRDSRGTLVCDGSDTVGHDLQLTFAARPDETYTASLYDVDFRGHHSFVYRLAIYEAPRVVTALPAAGRRGETRPVEFVGYGVATGAPQLESITRPVTFPADPKLPSFAYRLETPFGVAPSFSLGLSDLAEVIEGTAAPVPFAATGVLANPGEEDRFSLEGKKGTVWAITGMSVAKHPPLDLAVSILDAAGKELVRADDTPGSTDATISFTVPADGVYQVLVSESSGNAGKRSAVYRLTVEQPAPSLTFTLPDFLSVPLGGKVSLPVKIIRSGGFAEPVTVDFTGLPAGVTVPAPLVIPGDKSELPVELNCAADASVAAAVVAVQGTATLNGQPLTQRSNGTVVAITMKPRVKLVPEGLDDVRKWPRGTTYPAPVFVERLEGFGGEVVLEQTAHQQRVRQGITGPDFVVAPGVGKVDYPVFLPEWLETTKTSRIILNGVTKVPDPKGNVRHLLSKMELRIGMLPVGALLKITHDSQELKATAGTPFEIPVTVTRAAELQQPVVLELMLPRELTGQWTAQPITLPLDATTARFRIEPTAMTITPGEHELTLRATSMRDGKLPVLAETKITVDFVLPTTTPR